MDSTEEPEPCRLFSIPGELRNRIYRFAILQSTPIDITVNGIPQPALLLTCKVIRKEALKIFYYENTFELSVQNYDSTPIRRYTTHHRTLQLDCKKISLMVGASGSSPCWKNVMRWAKAWYDREVNHIPDQPRNLANLPNPHPVQVLVGALFHQCVTLADQPWEVVERTLLVLRPSLVLLEKRWGEE